MSRFEGQVVVELLIGTARELAGPIDVYCANAGVARTGLVDVAEKAWETSWQAGRPARRSWRSRPSRRTTSQRRCWPRSRPSGSWSCPTPRSVPCMPVARLTLIAG